MQGEGVGGVVKEEDGRVMKRDGKTDKARVVNGREGKGRNGKARNGMIREEKRR